MPLQRVKLLLKVAGLPRESQRLAGRQRRREEMRMQEDRAPKRAHETPARPERGPRSPGGTTYALALAGQSGSSPAEQTPTARPSKTRTIQGEFAEEERRVLEAASKQLAAKGSGGGKVGSSGRSGGRGVT